MFRAAAIVLALLLLLLLLMLPLMLWLFWRAEEEARAKVFDSSIDHTKQR